jgi:hypothetical protein
MAVTLVVSDGESEVPIELAGPGGKDRIAVGRPGRRSSVWMVWANKNKYDVYVAARAVAGIQKFSLHESGDWRHQWTPQADLERLVADQEGGSDRVLDRWQRPEPNGVGVRQGLSIWVPHGYINDLSDDEQAEDGVIWIPEPEPGHAIGIHVTVCTPDLGWATVHGARPAAGFSLNNGDAVIVYVSHSPVDDARYRWIEEHRAAAIAASGGKLDADGKNPQNLTMALFGRNEETGDRVVYGLAAFPFRRRGEA